MKTNTEKLKRGIMLGVCVSALALTLYFVSDSITVFAAAEKVEVAGADNPILDVSTVSYKPLAPLPGTFTGEKGKETTNMSLYLSGMLKLVIALGGALSILVAIIGGVQYVASGIAPNAKNEAKGRITNAFIGLTIILSSYLLLNTINPDLVNLKFSLEKVEGTHSKKAAGGRYSVYDLVDKKTMYMFGSKELCEKEREDLLAANKKVSACEPEGGALGVQAAGLRPIGCPAPEPGKVAIRCELCGDCVAVTDVKNKGCGISKCLLDKDLLKKIQNITPKEGWQITESWPPTVNHKSACHANGQCADLNNTSGDISITTIKKFYDAFRAAGLNVLYESKDCPKYIKAGITNCRTYDTMTNNSSFHVQ